MPRLSIFLLMLLLATSLALESASFESETESEIKVKVDGPRSRSRPSITPREVVGSSQSEEEENPVARSFKKMRLDADIPGEVRPKGVTGDPKWVKV